MREVWRYRVHGRVQGVGFRAFVWRLARDLEIDGWVRNRYDGTVEAQGVGETDALTRFRSSLEQGPRLARVDRIDVTEEQGIGDDPMTGFSVLPDA